MVSIDFRPGTLYILGPNGNYETFDNIAKVEELTYSEFADDMTYISSLDTAASSFECITKVSKEMLMSICGFRDAVLRCCPNKRVVHLALYAKKPRTRKKNFNRAIRILEGLK